jgi:hypothetical protein
MTSTNTILNLTDQYTQLHKDPSIFRGYSLSEHIPAIQTIVQNSNIKTLLDYGCGKAEMYDLHRLRQLWKLDSISLYDIGVPKYTSKPVGRFDMTVCVDVLEHIPLELLDQTMDELNKYTSKVLYLCVSCHPASKKLPDGRNAHLNVQTKEWWKQRIKQMDVYTKLTFS